MHWLVMGTLLASGVTAVPSWLGSKIGTPDPEHVPAPFTPLRQLGSAATPSLEVVGRRISFEAGPFPSQIVSAGEPLLRRPVVLHAETDRGALTWRYERLELQLGPAAGTWQSRGEADGWILTVAGRIEYDGLMIFDLELTPPQPGAALSELSLRVPMIPARALYHSYWPGRWGSAANSGALGDDGLAIPFKPLLWVGDNDRGLSLCAESDQGWRPADTDRALEVGPTGDRAVVAHLIGQSTVLDGPWRTALMLHPTPIKPLPADPHHLRINHGGAYGIETRPYTGPATTLSYDAAKVLDPRQGTLEAWVSPAFDPNRPLSASEQAGRGVFNRELFNVHLANGDRAGFYWNIDDRGMRYYFRKGREYPIIIGGRNPWQRGEVHQIALTWGDAIRIYADGQLVAEGPFEGLLGGVDDLAGARFTIGGAPCEFAVHALRTERTARTEFEPDARPKRTDATLLLEVGEQVGAAAEGGPITTTPGKFGLASCFYDPQAKEKTLLDAYRDAGVKTVVFHEHWTDIQDYGETTHRDELRALTAACHERGMKLIVYFGYEMSDIAPEWDEWHERCLVVPRAGGYKRQPKQTAYIVCYRSPWQDFLLEGIAHVVDSYGVDGVYLDGTIEPFGCANEYHGCGYVDADGRRRQTYPILAVRQLLRRMYTLLAERRDEVIIDAHQSLCMMTPTLSWCSGYWDGEQLTSQPAAADDRKALDYLPLDTFRAEFMGRQFGVPAMFLNYSGRPFQPSEALTFSLLHDVLPRGHGLNGVQQLVTPIWRIFDRLGRAQAEFVPYWESGELVSARPADVYVSVYRWGDQRLLLVIGNLGPAATVEVTIRPGAINGRPAARDAITGEGLPLTERTLRFDIGSLKHRLVEVEEAL